MRILKFGGKSLSTIEKTQKICKNIKKIYESDKKLIIVVSAMGNTTNDLLNLASKFQPQKKDKRDLDTLLSVGETISSSLFSIILNSIGVPAKSFQGWQIKIKTHGDFQNSLISSIDKKKLEECLNSNTVAVVSGFQGVNNSEEITTLGRGGSDTTAAALGAIFDTNVELYSDFNGMFSCDPRTIKTKKLNGVNLSQLNQLGEMGSKLVCERAVKIARANKINLKLKSSDKPNQKGTAANFLEYDNVIIHTNPKICEIILNISNNQKLLFLSKNVLKWLNKYKIYNFSVKFQNIVLLVNDADKDEILQILKSKLKI